MKEDPDDILINLKTAKCAIKDSMTMLGERIELDRGLYSELEYAHYYIEEQETRIAKGISVPVTYATTAAAIAHSGSAMSERVTELINSGKKEFQDISSQAYALSNAVTGTTAMISLATTGTINFSGPSPNADIDWTGLRGRFEKIDPNLVRMLNGAMSALNDLSADSVRQACHSMRECLTYLTRSLAPDEGIKNTPWFVADKTSRSGVTRKHRLQYMILGSKANSATKQDVVDLNTDLITATLELNDDIMKSSHDLRETTAEAIRPVFATYCKSLISLIDIHEQNGSRPKTAERE